MNKVTDESNDSESEELSDYMSDEENTSQSASDKENMEDSKCCTYNAKNIVLAESTNRRVWFGQ